tara:strand:+ start:515 stop:1108 length:594 start_codon:yes stop_codon:yes gene_type:complete
MSDNRKNLISHVISLISEAKQIEDRLKNETKDPNCIYKYYDKNKALRVGVDAIDGKATGTCVNESQQHVVKLLNSGINIENIKLIKCQIFNEDLNRNIFHQFIGLNINGKWYNESHSNGLHKRIPMDFWFKANPIVDGTIQELTLRLRDIETIKEEKCNKKTIGMKQVKRRMNRKKKSHWRKRVKALGKANIVIRKI